jgi:uncharacterized OB-fold protein
MTETELLKPALYATEGTASVPDHPSLKGGKCQCGYVFFPLQTYGCEVCGRTGDALQPVALSGRGTLIASSTVHIHAAKNQEAPFTIGAIKLDDGPTVRTLLVDVDAKALKPGQPMVTQLVPVSSAAGKTFDLRFTTAS